MLRSSGAIRSRCSTGPSASFGCAKKFEIGWGDFTVLTLRDRAVLAMRYDWRNNSVLFLHNLHEQPREILLDPGVSGEHGKLLVNLLAEDHSEANKAGKHRIVLEGYGYRWYRIGGLDYLLRRT